MKQIVIILICLFLISCGNNEKERNNVRPEAVPSNVENMLENKINIFSPNLLKEIHSIFAYYDTLYKDDDPYRIRVFIVSFSQKGEDCYITIQTSLYYDSGYLKGYALVKDKMVAFYNPEDKCNKGLIDSTKLDKGHPENFPNENSNFARNTTHDPSGRTYKIHGQHSLELIFTGYF